MITSLKLVRNVGSFDSYQDKGDTNFKSLTLIYAENGRGKTTLGAILRSLGTGESHLIEGRCRLGSQSRPHVVIERASTSQPCVYQNGQWATTHPSLVVFDDRFVDDNVYSGLTIGAGHRQNLHEVILGKQGVSLARQVENLAEEITFQNKAIRDKAASIPKKELHNQDIDIFSDLAEDNDIDKHIVDQSKKVDALKRADAVKTTRFFSRLELPEIDVESIDSLLAKQLDDLDKIAITQVQSRIMTLDSDGESWAGSGTGYLETQDDGPSNECPYCGQDIQGIDLVEAYRAYFGDSYRSHLASIKKAVSEHNTVFGGDSLATLQQAVGQLSNRFSFWKPLVTLPDVKIDADVISTVWTEARDALSVALASKLAAPLDATSLNESIMAKIVRYGEIREEVTAYAEQLVACNLAITEIKEATESGDIEDVSDEFARLQAIKSRHSQSNKIKCKSYLDAKSSKSGLEQRKQAARESLDTYRRQVFPKYCTAINKYLKKFGASFTIEGVKPQDKAGRPSTAYHIHILDNKVPLQSKSDNEPAFHNTLSAGDRNTLALAFFFASLETDPKVSDTVVVIDDPISSFDDGRSMTTMQEVRRLTGITKQVIVLSHVKSFLCRLHKHAKPEDVSTLCLRRMGDCQSTLEPWEPTEDEFTEYDHYHRALREFKAGTATDIRHVAKSVRLVMEGYLRVAYPEHCPPGTTLGSFRHKIQTLIERGNSILSNEQLTELDEIREYANRFHHETNAAWELEIPSDGELLGFVNRVLYFIAD